MHRSKLPYLLLWRSPRRPGFTYLELMFALLITGMVGVAASVMLGAVTAGVGTKRDSRSMMVNALGAQARLTAYLAPGRCLLAQTTDSFTLWLDDRRVSDTVHATEIRWFSYDSSAKTFSVSFVQFPDGWTETAKNLADLEYPRTAKWNSVLATYQVSGHITSIILIDQLQAIAITTDNLTAQLAKHLVFDLTYPGTESSLLITVAGSIHKLDPPLS